MPTYKTPPSRGQVLFSKNFVWRPHVSLLQLIGTLISFQAWNVFGISVKEFYSIQHWWEKQTSSKIMSQFLYQIHDCCLTLLSCVLKTPSSRANGALRPWSSLHATQSLIVMVKKKGKCTKLIQHFFSNIGHTQHFTLEPHSPICTRKHINKLIQSSVGNSRLSILQRGTLTCDRRNWTCDCKTTTLPAEPQSPRKDDAWF